MAGPTSSQLEIERFWCLRDQSFAIDEDGFLAKDERYDPSPNAVPVAKLEKVPCLVLLGSPGMGKSVVLQDAFSGVQKQTPALVDLIDLGEFNDEARLEARVFGNPMFLAWLGDSTQAFTLFLDSFDECALGLKNIARFLNRRFRELGSHTKRIRLRIACRTADWPSLLEEELPNLWGIDNVRIYELLPLRREDAERAAETLHIDGAQFLTAVVQTRTGPLAAKPVTLLKMLIPEFKKAQRLPVSQAELYGRATRLLASETSTKLHGKTDSSAAATASRLRSAEYVACLLTFAGRGSIDLDRSLSEGRGESLHIHQLLPDVRGDVPSFYAPSSSDIVSLANCGLMEGGSARDTFRFLHRSVQEFLCAKFIHSLGLSLTKVLPLFVDAEEANGGIAPQLGETAGWLASLNKPFRDAILQRDPALLLNSDVEPSDVETRRRLLQSLVELIRKRQINDRGFELKRTFRQLLYPGIERELQRLIQDNAESQHVREFAEDLVWTGKLDALYPLLADVALNEERPYRERSSCASTVAHAAGRSEHLRTAKGKLVPLLRSSESSDPEDSLRGYALLACWPEFLSAQELFDVLTPQYAPHFLGDYWSAIGKIGDSLQIADLPCALDWTTRQSRRHEQESTFRRLMNRIFGLAWDNLDAPGVLPAFARAALERVRRYEGVSRSDEGRGHFYANGKKQRIGQNDEEFVDEPREKKRRLCEALVPILDDPEKQAANLSCHAELVDSDDFEWVIEHYLKAAEESERAGWLKLALFIWRGLPEQLAYVKEHSNKDAQLAAAFREPVALTDPNSPESIAQRLRWAQYDQEKTKPEKPVPSPRERIAHQLERFEKGNPDAWVQLNFDMTLDDESTHYGSDLLSDLTSTPGWKYADLATRTRILLAAEKYLFSTDAKPELWLGTTTYYHATLSGFRALRVLQAEDKDRLDALPNSVWDAWIPIVLDFPNAVSGAELEPNQDLVSLAYRRSPTEFLAFLRKIILAQNKSGHLSVLWLLKNCWDAQILGELLEVANEEQLKVECLEELLSALIKHGSEDARAHCVNILRRAMGRKYKQPRRVSFVRVASKVILLAGASPDEWEMIWRVYGESDEIAKQLTLEVLKHRDSRAATDLLGRLREDQLADFYLRLLQLVPKKAVKRKRGFHRVTASDEISRLASATLGVLRDRSTLLAVTQIQKLREQLGFDWLSDVEIGARLNLRRARWSPLPPALLVQYLAVSRTRLVNGEQQLLDVTMEALERIGVRLQLDPPAAPDLWSMDKKTAWPKSEPDLCRWLERQLRMELVESGALVLREVEIRKGNETDIYVVAKPKAEEPEFGLIVEVKGCWHRDVETSPRTQLAERYLVHHQFRHGIYLVGWYYCPRWNKKSDRRKSTHAARFRNLGVEDARKHFSRIASAAALPNQTIRAVVLDCAID